MNFAAIFVFPSYLALNASIYFYFYLNKSHNVFLFKMEIIFHYKLFPFNHNKGTFILYMHVRLLINKFVV